MLFSAREHYKNIENQPIPLEKLTLGNQSACPRLTLHKNGEELQTEAFDYYHQEAIAKDFVAQFAPERSEEVKDHLEMFGLQDISFKVFSRKPETTLHTSTENDTQIDHHVYVLIHGWSGNKDIYDNVTRENGSTEVEEIMARDPNAIVVTMDGNGFGGTKFQDYYKSRELMNYCSSEQYANQTAFFIQNVLGIENSDQVSILGHSMGGAAAISLSARYGYKTVAAAPAAYPNFSNLEQLAKLKKDPAVGDFFNQIEQEQENNLERQHIAARTVYHGLGKSIGFGEFVAQNRLKPVLNFTENTVKNVFTGVAPHLIGELSDDPETNQRMFNQLSAIHDQEFVIEKLPIDSAAILRLRQGIDLTKWSNEEFCNLENTTVMSGDDDTLVTPQELLSFWETAYAITAERYQRAPIEYNWKAFSTIARKLKQIRQPEFRVDKGHYDALYDEKTIEQLVATNPNLS